MESPGQIVILNGVPRSGKSAIAAAIQDRFDGPWMNLGVEAFVRHVTPKRFQPGIGLRPGGERPDLEDFVFRSYLALYDSIAAHSRLGLNVVADVGHHGSFVTRGNMLPACAARLIGLPVLVVGVRCPIEVVMERRRLSLAAGSPHYAIDEALVRRWQDEVHKPGIYDVEVDTSLLSPEACAELIRQSFASGSSAPRALDRLSGM